ncbi:MAG: sulfotransferase [Phycisphaerales bacterium]|nr:sulfotransferase [Phycisphaerales bacterium]
MALDPPIFVLGNVRSGTTLIQDSFGLVKGVESWFEPRTIWAYADPGRRHDRFTAEDATPKVKAYIRRRFEKRQKKTGARVMEKTPSNVMRIPYVHAVFPESKFIYVIREPLAHISSAEYRWRNAINFGHLMERFLETPKTQLHHYAKRVVSDHFRRKVLKQKHVSVWGVRYPGIYEDLPNHTTEEIIGKQWAACSKQVAEDLAALPPDMSYQVRYEDFVKDPVTHFRNMMDLNGLELTKDVEDRIARRTDSSRQAKWKRLGDDTIRKILPYVVDEMARHGYEVPEEYREAVS